MINVSDNLWVGNSLDGQSAEFEAVLNVARDLHIKRGWPTIEYMQVGLVDGPGNRMSSYYAAVLALATLMKLDKRVLIHCHEGKSRSVAIAVMYLHLVGRRGWEHTMQLIRERVDVDIPEPHVAHREAFDRMDWKLLVEAIK